ncbi:MAG: hypothetical protein E6H75_01625 [Betaproteobacteria bacterium]|nr:MAG: hypothetical protein E6H75_01625 [Betaproteobacteria bacterium]
MAAVVVENRHYGNCLVRRMALGCRRENPGDWVMKHERELRAAASDMLSQLRPRNVLRDARDFLLKLRHDEVFREYLAARVWVVLAMLLLFFFISTVCAIDIMFNSVRLIRPPVPVWYRGLALLLGAAVWVGGMVAQIYVFLIWLEERAAQKSRRERGIRVALPASVDSRRAVRRRAPRDPCGSCAPDRRAARRPGDSRSRALQEIRFLTTRARSAGRSS